MRTACGFHCVVMAMYLRPQRQPAKMCFWQFHGKSIVLLCWYAPDMYVCREKKRQFSLDQLLNIVKASNCNLKACHWMVLVIVCEGGICFVRVWFGVYVCQWDNSTKLRKIMHLIYIPALCSFHWQRCIIKTHHILCVHLVWQRKMSTIAVSTQSFFIRS